MSEKKTKGKQKIKMEKIKKDSDRLVTFSKRRSGINKKISELSILCGAEIAFLAFSSSGKPYTFSSPTSFESIVEQFLTGYRPQGNDQNTLVEMQRRMIMRDVCNSYDMAKSELEDAKEKKMRLEEWIRDERKEIDAWWKIEPSKIEDQEEVMRLMKRYEELYENLLEIVNKKSRGKALL